MKRVIDHEKCIGCGRCVRDCVNKYIKLDDSDKGKKSASFVERGRCLECGHCNAICPQGAIIGGQIEELPTRMDSLLSLMTKKRTVREYIKGATISQNDLDYIILAGQSAPTNRNRKSARMIFIKEHLPIIYNTAVDYLVERVQQAGTIDPLYVPTMRMSQNRSLILWGAEYLVVFAGSSQTIIDAAISAERMQLEAEALGIGTAYRGDMVDAINNVDDLRNLIGLRSNEMALIAFAMGVSNVKYYRSAVKNNRKVVFK